MTPRNFSSPLLKGHGLPNFKEITPVQIKTDIPILIDNLKSKFSHLEENISELLIKEQPVTWEIIMDPLYEIGEDLRWSWGIVTHLNAVCNSQDLRDAYSSQQPEIIRLGNKLGQSQLIYKALSELKQNGKHNLNRTQLRIIESEILSMKNRGVGLNKDRKMIFNSRSERLAELSNQFSNNVLDATKTWSLLLNHPKEIEGLPKRALETMAIAAKEAGDIHITDKTDPSWEKGPWRVGLDMPRYIPFMTYSKSRELREKIYKAFVSRASKGTLNNQEIIVEILDLRKQQAQELGYKNWAEISLCNKMARKESAVDELLEELRTAALPFAKKEIEALKEFARNNGSKESSDLAPWDISFWSEKLREKLFDLDQEKLRPWFPLDQVLNGLFSLCTRLFDITFEQADKEAPTWHEDVRFFNVIDRTGNKIASFFLDPFSRPSNKRGGAWMDECLSRHKNKEGEIVLPVAYLVCNQTPPVGNTPSLMSFSEVETLFHEFGHGLQHMLTTVEYPQAAGINNVEWDAVELPSQFMENWCLEKKTISEIAKHWETKQPLPKEEIDKLRKSKTFNSGLATLRQIHFAITDLKLHSQWDNDDPTTPDQIRREIAKTTSVIPPIPEDQFLCAFSHIFAGGYSAGYYSYKWAEVLSSDAFEAFEEVGLHNEQEIKFIGERYRNSILSLGGSLAPIDIFTKFRGRPPSTKALIRHCGLK